MKTNVFMLAVVASFLMATGLSAQGIDRPLKPKPPRMAALDLTDEQIATLQDLKLKLEKEILPLRSQLPSIEADLKQELLADQVNQAKVKSLIEQKVKIHADLELKRFQNQRAMRDLLTAEQRKKFDLHVLKGGSRQHGRRFGPQEQAKRPNLQRLGMWIRPPDLKNSKFEPDVK